MLKAWAADGSAQEWYDRNFPWVFAGWAERDGQNGWDGRVRV